MVFRSKTICLKLSDLLKTYLLSYGENTIVALDATCWLDFSSCTTTPTLTIMQRWFSPLECLVEFDLINENKFEIGSFDPYIVILLVSMMRASYQTLIVHHPNPSTRAQLAS